MSTRTAARAATRPSETGGLVRGLRGRAAGDALPFLVMAVFAVYMLAPLWWLLIAASKQRSDLNSTNPLWFADFELFGNIADVATHRDGMFLRWTLNSLLYAGVGALGATVFAGMAGYVLAKFRFRGRELLFNVVLGGVLVPATALALPLFLLFSNVGQTNSFWAVFLPSLVSPFGVYLSRVYAASGVPDELLEAARIDGSGELRTFFRVAAPIMAPALVTVYLFQFVHIWNNFFLPLIMLRSESLFPVTLGLYVWNSQATQQAAELRTFVIVGALLSVVPLIIAFLCLQRFWRSGLGTGGVK
ncbi:carbohydrate ABC transporter permease [Jiangella aurantiaca]|uniref:Carbohydrate ABC transporter permease n=1 Tax=Jiangella aurantiaca TaxID=2530373 RepID=A0A4R5AJ57_9ACTN|nr:carbohydrate ABC transporter permease [Jiangella aurantiaca]TDD72591.1 carbohydrate ABC transporter permease [Jiangella aurantiaca]